MIMLISSSNDMKFNGIYITRVVSKEGKGDGDGEGDPDQDVPVAMRPVRSTWNVSSFNSTDSRRHRSVTSSRVAARASIASRFICELM